MMSKIKFFISVVIVAMMGAFIIAQNSVEYQEPCNVDDFDAQIDELFAEYLATRQIDQSTDGALASIQALNAELEAAYQSCLALQRDARSDDLTTLLGNLQQGGYIIYVRHTHTDRVGSGDTNREGCDDQRNLSTRGRIEAQAINESYATLDLPIGEIISTELCRTLDTTELAFGEPTDIIPRNELENTLADVLTIEPEAGTNTIIVAHIGTLVNNFGMPIPFDEGDAYVFLPMGDNGFELVGRIALLDWEFLVELSGN